MDLKKLLTIVTEAELTPQQQAQNVLQPGMNPTNPWTNDPAKSAAWAKLSPADQKWLGGADPTDPYILARAPNKGKAVTPAAPAAAPAAAAPASPDQSGKPAADPEKEKKVARFKELLTKSGMLTATPAASAEVATNYSLAPTTATGPGIKLPAVKESVAFKSSIGKMLLESFDIGLEEAPATQLSPEEYKELSKLYGDLSVTYKGDATLAPLFTAYNNVKPSWAADAQATAPATSTKPTKQLLPVDANIKKFQDEVLKIDNTAFPKFGADGRKGREVNNAIAKFPEIAKKYGLSSVTPTAPAPTAPATGTVDQSGKPAPAATAPATDTNIAQIPATADKKQPYWVVGTRYEWRNQYVGGRATAPVSSWVKTAEPSDKLQLNATRARSMSKFTGADSDYGKQTTAPVTETTSFANDEVQRIVSLVHHR